MRWCLTLVIFFLLPYSANASISFSEIAWMGSATSANHEWIELHNDGSSQDVTGWVLSDGANLSIQLSGVISSNSYAVLERTSDASASGKAFLIYTGSLVNTGATLRLERADGTLVDQVSGGSDWEIIGGNNVTKETAQYTSAGWVTAPPTPGKVLNWTEEDQAEADAEEEEDEDVSEKENNNSKSTKSKSKETVKLTLPGVNLDLEVKAQEVGYVNQPISFSINPSGIGKSLIDSLQYEWNFGDGETSAQKETTHIFSYPGSYVVTVYAGYKRQEQIARHEITILPVTVSLTVNKAGDVQVNNDSVYEIDISHYRLRGEKIFEFPARSIIMPGQTITISKHKLGDTKERLVSLYDNKGTSLDSLMPIRLAYAGFSSPQVVDKPVPKISSIAISKPSNKLISDTFGFAKAEASVINEEEDTALVKVYSEEDLLLYDNNVSSSQVAAVAESTNRPENQWTYLALVGLLLLGTTAVFVKPKNNESK